MQLGFFDIDPKYQNLSELGDPLEIINQLIDFNMFNDIIQAVFQKKLIDRINNPKNVGRPPTAAIMVIKIIFLKRFHNLSNHKQNF